MNTTTIKCSRDTYVSRYSKTTNHAGTSKLSTGRGGVIGKTSVQTALLQFSIPKAIQYKQITKVVLNYYCGVISTSLKLTAADYTPYLIDNVTDAITYSNVDVLGTLGEKKTVNHAGTANCWIAEDITDIFTNNLTNGVFSVFVAIGKNSSDDEHVLYYVGGISGGYGASLVITYEDVEQLPPTITYPSDVYVRQGEPVLFSWVYNSLTAAVQASVTLEWKAESATTYNVITLMQKEQSYQANIDFPAGNIDWRIKVTNDVGETSTYSEAKFVVIGKPAIPVITEVKNRALTEIIWNASDQCVYEIIISDAVGNVLVSEVVHSGEMSYKPQMFLTNGTYNIRIRTKNSIELWSDYTNKTVTISAVAPVQPTLAMIQEKEQVRILIEHASGTKAAVLRSENGGDFKIVAVLEDGETEYMDETVRSGAAYIYKVRAYGEGYIDSASRSISFEFEGIYLQGGGEKLHMMMSEDEFLTHTEIMSREVVLTNYSGRKLPVAERGEHRTRKIQRKAYISFGEKELFERIAASDNTFYRDKDGNAFACVVSTQQYTRYKDRGLHVSFEITEVEGEEVVINV